MRIILSVLLVIFACVVGIAQTSTDQAPLAASDRARLERELALVQHIRRHLRDPQDGLSLAADRADLMRVRAGAPRAVTPATPSMYAAAPMPGTTGGSAALAVDLEILGEIWNARVNDRTPFHTLGRDRVQALERGQQSLSRIGSTMDVSGRDGFVPGMQQELMMLMRDVQGHGELSDPAIEAALMLAEGRAAGRPLPPGPGFAGPGSGRPPSRDPRVPPGYGMRPPPPGTSSEPPLPPGYGMAAPPPGSPSDSPLPPGYDMTAPAGLSPCVAERTRAGLSGSTIDMLGAADCWARDRSSPFWAGQLLETLDWAVQYASSARDCTGLETVTARLGSFGMIPSPYPQDRRRLADLASAAEARLGWLRTSENCR